MAMEQIMGTAAVYGLNGTLQIGSFWTTADVKYQEFGLRQTTDKADFKDGMGTVIGKRYYNHQHELTITFVPIKNGATSAAANTKLPPPGSTVTLASFGLGSNLVDGDWTFDGDATVTPSADGSAPLRIQMTLKRWAYDTWNTPKALTPVT